MDARNHGGRVFSISSEQLSDLIPSLIASLFDRLAYSDRETVYKV